MPQIILYFEGVAVNVFKVSGPNSGQLQFYDNILDSDSFANFIRIDPDYSSTTHVNVKGNSLVNGSADLFDTTGGATGTYTAVADNSIAATAVTSVTDNAGIAVFTHAGTSPLLGSTVDLSTFSEATYNVTGIVSATAATTFEVEVQGVGVAFVATDTGSYLMTGVTITSTAHGRSNGDTLTTSSDLSTEYDGGHIIYNVQTNTFDVFETFGATQTGSWDTSGLDQTDPRVIATDNPGKADSRIDIESKLDGNTAVTDVPAALAKVLINANATWISPQAERLKLLADGGATLTANQPDSLTLDGNVFLEPASSTKGLSSQFVRQDEERRTVTFTNGTNVINETSTPRADGDTILFTDTAGTLPAELREDIVYYVVTGTTNTFQVAYTSGGSAIAFTDDGSGSNSYATSDLIGSVSRNTIAANSPRDVTPHALDVVEKDDRIHLTITNEDDSVNIQVSNGYYRIVN